MNIDLKDSLLRFFVPASIFFSISYWFSDNFQTSVESINIFILTVHFVAFGFFIGALGTVLQIGIEWMFSSPWRKDPLQYWEIVGSNSYIQNKIEKTWSFYTLNLYSLVAAILTLIYCASISISTTEKLVIILVSCLFLYLTIFNFRKITNIAKELLAEE